MSDGDWLVLGETDKKARFSEIQAQQVVAGYCFGRFSESFVPLRGSVGYGEPLPDLNRVAFGYETYDCIPASSGSQLSELDLLISAGLNGKMDVSRLASLQRAASAVGQCVDELDRRWAEVRFWDLAEADVTSPAPDTPGWWMSRAWWLFMSLPDVNVAVTHKTLHHKRPWLFPLVDGKTRDAYPRGRVWAGILEDLKTNESKFAALEDWFSSEASTNRTPGLTRLRLHDILLWSWRTGKHEYAARLGAPMVSDPSP